MKAFLLLFCVVAASAQADDLKRRLQACAQASAWTKEEFGKTCHSDPPTDPAGLARHKEFSFCVLEASNIIEATDGGVVIHPENGATFAADGHGEKAVDKFTQCAPRAKAQSTPKDAALELHHCVRSLDKAEYAADCQAFAENVFT